MKRGFAYSRPLAVSAIAALAAVAASYAFQAAMSARLLDQRRRAEIVEAGLSGRIAARSAYDGASLEALRTKARRFRVSLGQEGTWRGVGVLLGGDWAAVPGAKEERRGYSVQSGEFRLSSSSVGAWPAIVRAVSDLEAIPGVDVAEFEMRTTGDAASRSLEVARIVVEARERRGGSLAESSP
jgi:hypothetical protein